MYKPKGNTGVLPVPEAWSRWLAGTSPCLCDALDSVPHKVDTLNLTVCSFLYLLVIDGEELLTGRLPQLCKLSVEQLCSYVISSSNIESAKKSKGSFADRHLAEIRREAAWVM